MRENYLNPNEPHIQAFSSLTNSKKFFECLGLAEAKVETHKSWTRGVFLFALWRLSYKAGKCIFRGITPTGAVSDSGFDGEAELLFAHSHAAFPWVTYAVWGHFGRALWPANAIRDLYLSQSVATVFLMRFPSLPASPLTLWHLLKADAFVSFSAVASKKFLWKF